MAADRYGDSRETVSSGSKGYRVVCYAPMVVVDGPVPGVLCVAAGTWGYHFVTSLAYQAMKSAEIIAASRTRFSITSPDPLRPGRAGGSAGFAGARAKRLGRVHGAQAILWRRPSRKGRTGTNVTYLAT